MSKGKNDLSTTLKLHTSRLTIQF